MLVGPPLPLLATPLLLPPFDPPASTFAPEELPLTPLLPVDATPLLEPPELLLLPVPPEEVSTPELLDPPLLLPGLTLPLPLPLPPDEDDDAELPAGVPLLPELLPVSPGPGEVGVALLQFHIPKAARPASMAPCAARARPRCNFILFLSVDVSVSDLARALPD